VLLGELRLEKFGGILPESGEDLFVHTRNPGGGQAQSLAVGVLSDPFQYHSDSRFDLFAIHSTASTFM